MSLNGQEVVEVKVEPLSTDDEGVSHSNIHLEIKVEPDCNIEAHSPSQCRDQQLKNDLLTTNRIVDIDYEMKKKTEPSKALQDSWFVDQMVKVERDDVPNVSEVASHVNEYTYNTLLMQRKSQTDYKNFNVKKERNAIKPTNTSSSIVATPTDLYNDHGVTVKMQVDELTNKVPCILGSNQNDLLMHSEERAEVTHMDASEAINGLCIELVEIEVADPFSGSYMDHIVKEELVAGPEVLQRLHQETSRKNHNKQMGTKTKSFTPQLLTVKDNKRHKCDVCDFASVHKNKLNEHNKKHSGEKPFQCRLCSYASAFKYHLQIHERSHSKIKPFKCDKCSYTCVQKSGLMIHERKHTGEKPYKCNYCAYACARKGTLSNHIKRHTGEKPFQCQLCKYGCILKRELIAHTRINHTEDGQELKEIYKCKYCHFSTAIKQSWITHERRMHTSEKPYQCKHCNYAVFCKNSFLSHTEKHTGEQFEKKHKCSHCDYATNYKSQFIVHQRSHTGEKPYKCSHCVYASAYRRELLVHEAQHTGERTYKCNRCTYGCDSPGTLTFHEKIHVGVKEN